MSEARPTRPRVGVPEVLSLVAVIGIGVVLWQRTRSDEAEPPPEEWRCGSPSAWADCFQRVEGGPFTMGAQAADPGAPGYDAEAAENEGPVHVVKLTTFWIQKTEATVGAYRRCVRAGACSEDEVEQGGGFSTYYPASAPDDPLRETNPVSSVTWKGASDLCAWIGGRLPTEAEWERAARGTDARRWPWGNVPKCAFPSDAEGYARLTAGDAKTCQQDGPARADDGRELGPGGIIGMAGNLWEWTLDAYAADAYARHAEQDPRTTEGDARTQRGGSWMSTKPGEIRTTVRGGLEPSAKLNDVGFRCVYGGASP